MPNFEQLCNDYRENKRMIDELTAMNDELKAQIVVLMGDKETVSSGAIKVSYKTVSSERLDTKRIKSELPDVYARYSVQSQYKRFTVN